MDWETIQIVITNQAIYTANGFLAILYWLWENGAMLLALPPIYWIIRHFDLPGRALTGFRPRRYGRDGAVRAGHGAFTWTLAAAGLWLAAATLSAPPVPIIGAAMWWTLALGAHLMPREREALLFRHKGLIAGYGLLAMGFWAILSYNPTLGRLSALVGSWREATALVTSVKGSLVPYAALAIWVLYPLGYFVLLVQRYLVQQGPQVGPGATAEEVIRELRQRGGA